MAARDLLCTLKSTCGSKYASTLRLYHDVYLANVTIEGPATGEIHHTADLTMTDVVIRTEDGEQIACEDCRNVDKPIVEIYSSWNGQ